SAPRPLPLSPLFPYTTLFRSVVGQHINRPKQPYQHDSPSPVAVPAPSTGTGTDGVRFGIANYSGNRARAAPAVSSNAGPARRGRSEEHTSELQSHLNLVCRLL